MSHTFVRKSTGILLGLVIAFAGVSPARAADGSLDPTFGNGGIVITDIRGNDDLGLDVTVQPDGKILVAGTSANSDGADNDFGLARYNPDGSLDATFDVDGMVVTDIGDYDSAAAIALQADGKIIAAGYANNGTDSDFALARYNPNGSLDPTFDLDGKVTTPVSPWDDFGEDVALQPDGKILLTGFSFDSSVIGTSLIVVRYNSDGSLDTTFGNGGVAINDFGCGSSGHALALQPDGKLIVAGDSCTDDARDFAVARFNSDGSPDLDFGTAGRVITDFGDSYDSSSAVAVQPDGKIVLAGHSYTLTDTHVVFALARYNSDGSLDKSFDEDGKVTTDLGGWRDFGHALTLQPDGKLVVAGEQWQEGGTVDFALARYNSDGSLDPAFDSDGIVVTDMSSGDYAAAVALQPDGRILVAGLSDNGFNFDFALARYDAEAIGNTITLLVPATANPWLAGMPDGTLSHFGDSAPANSPTEVRGLSLTPGTSVFFSVTGLVSHGHPEDPLIQTTGPDGGTTVLSHDFGSENGISDVQAPINGLLGVFLGPDQPHSFPPPGALDFNSSANRDYLSLSPELQQVFFIGDGLTSAGQVQEIVVPAGATRLFIGPMDASQYNNNQGYFTVHISMTIQVTVDVRPGKFPNRIELKKNVCKKNDNLPVAILTTPEFDALRLVDATSLQMGDPVLGGTAAPIHSQGRDIDRDGDLDVWLLFALCDLVSNNALDENSTELVLSGNTLDGAAFTARDSVEVIGHRPPKLIVPKFDYPVDGQVLDYEGSYLFRVQPIPSAEGFLWGFFQNGVMV